MKFVACVVIFCLVFFASSVVHAGNCSSRSALYDVIVAEDLVSLRTILAREPTCLTGDAYNSSPLMVSAQRKRFLSFKELLTLGADPNEASLNIQIERDSYGNIIFESVCHDAYVFHVVSFGVHKDAKKWLELLSQHGAGFSQLPPKEGGCHVDQPALYYTLFNEDLEAARYLLSFNDIVLNQQEFFTPNFAKETVDIGLAKDLIKQGVKADSVRRLRKTTALHLARDSRFAALLLDNGADVNSLADYNGFSPLGVVGYTQSAKIDLLLSSGASLALPGYGYNGHKTPIIHAWAEGYKWGWYSHFDKAVATNSTFEINILDSSGRNLLMSLARSGVRQRGTNDDLQIIQLLLDRGIDKKHRDHEGRSALDYWEALVGTTGQPMYPEVIEFLRHNGVQ